MLHLVIGYVICSNLLNHQKLSRTITKMQGGCGNPQGSTMFQSHGTIETTLLAVRPYCRTTFNPATLKFKRQMYSKRDQIIVMYSRTKKGKNVLEHYFYIFSSVTYLQCLNGDAFFKNLVPQFHG